MSSPREPSRGGPTVHVWNGYSLAERDRRWAAVRAQAAAAGLDCVWVPLGDGVDGRYLTQLRCSSIVLPSDGRDAIVVADRGSRNSWVPEPRLIGRDWPEPMAQALMDAGMEGRRIGVVGLHGGVLSHVRAADGVAVHSALEHVRQRLPRAEFVDATDVVGRVRYVKSEEEIACLRRAVEIAEAGVDELIAGATPGVDMAGLYARVMGRMLRMGSEYYPLALSLDGERHTNPAAGLSLEAGTLLGSEVSAVWGTQVAQQDQPIFFGTPSASWQAAIDLQRRAFERGLEIMKPGATVGELLDGIAALRTPELRVAVLLHGRGAGDDGPLVSPRSSGEAARSLRFEAGNAFVWKPAVTAKDGFAFTWGGTVIITSRGAEKLFQQEHGLVRRA